MHTIIVSDTDTFDLLLVLQEYAVAQSDAIEQAFKDEAAGKKTVLFDNYIDFIAALEAHKDHAKKFMKDIQKQTGVTIMFEQAIYKL